jgi:alpha-L-rhamnosidase
MRASVAGSAWYLCPRRLALGLVALLVVCTPAAAGADSARRLSRKPVAVNPVWMDYVIHPGGFAYPKSVEVVGDAADVHNPDGLKAEGGSATTISSTGVGAPRLVLDLDFNVGGDVEVGVTQSDGTEIKLGYSELREFLTPSGDTGQAGLSLGVSDEPEGRSDTIQTAGPVDFRSPGIRGAQRYIALQLQGPGTASIDYVRVRVEHPHPGPGGYDGYFLSSDRKVNRAWYASAYTFAIDSIKDQRPGNGVGRRVVVDGAKRDRLIWAGDMNLENLLGNYSLKIAPAIIERSIQAFSCLQFTDGQLAPTTQIATQCPDDPPPPISGPGDFPPSAQPPLPGGFIKLPEYTASWIIALRDYYFFTGDAKFAARMMPVVRRGIAYFMANLDGGLYRTPASALNWHPFDSAAGFDTHTNAQLHRALLAAAELERLVGGGEAAANAYQQDAVALRKAINHNLWDARAGAYIINPADPRQNHTQDAQVESILGGVATSKQARQALDFIDRHLLARHGVANGEFVDDPYMSNYISPFISSTELLARLHAGDAKGALKLIRRTWGQMLAKGPGTVWEKMGFDGMPANYAPFQAPVDPYGPAGAGGTSLAHGWAGGPVPALSGYVLGIRPRAPGYSEWVVAPQPGDLRFAQGKAPTPHGALASRWKLGSHKHSFKLTVASPRRTSGVVKVPLLGHPRTIAIDGEVAWRDGKAVGGAKAKRHGNAVAFEGIKKTHTFAWR